MLLDVTARFSEVFARIIGTEGGYTNNPNDPGGETKYGISKRSYPNVDIRNLTLDGAKAIYYADFWRALGLDQVSVGLDEFIFDFAVNSGVPKVARLLQKAAGCLPDGLVGPQTVAAVLSKPPAAIARLLFVERAIIMTSAKPDTFEIFCHGWFARLFDQTKLFFSVK
jgi:lysozyme family protein